MNPIACVFLVGLVPLCFAINGVFVSNFTVNVVRTQQAVVLGCSDRDLLDTGSALMAWNQVILLLNLNRNFSLETALTRHNHAKTSVILDCACSEYLDVLQTSSTNKYFNKTYQWLILDPKDHGLQIILGNLSYIGPNAQITYVDSNYTLIDVHAKGSHLGAPLLAMPYGKWSGKLDLDKDINDVQGIKHRNQFSGLQLRGTAVIDRDNITTNDQIISILAETSKTDGVATFVKYHFDLICFLQDQLNFTILYRNARGWAGRLGSGRFRLGLLGIMTRNEADISASGAFNRINRHAEFDTIHQSWMFDIAFLYRFTTDVDTDGRSGNFFAPFEVEVWEFCCVTVAIVIGMWSLVALLRRRMIRSGVEQVGNNCVLNTLAAICQQGLEPIPRCLPSRTIVFTLFVFSLVMYNYYTSSVVGGLLQSSGQGPKTIAEIVNSPLKLSFEDIGYYKILFKDNKTSLVQKMYRTKVLPKRSPDELQVFTSLKQAIPFLKKGGHAFHCELVDAYPEIARLFDANEICDLRVVSGLLETEILNWILPKNSMYTEFFRIIMHRAREVGVVRHTLRAHRPKQPQCQSGYTIYPVTMSGVVSAFEYLGVGMLVALMALVCEILIHRVGRHIQE